MSSLNTSQNLTSEQKEIILHQLNEEIFTKLIPTVCFCGTLSILGTIGNTVAIYIFAARMKRNFQNDLFVVVCVASFMACAICLPTDIFDFRYSYIYPSAAMCQINRYLNFVSIAAAVFTLDTLAIFRLKAATSGKVLNPGRRSRLLAILVLLVSSCFISGIAVVVYGIHNSPIANEVITGRECTISDDMANTVWPTIMNIILLLGFVTLVLITVVAYYKIWKIVKKSRMTIAAHSIRNAETAAKPAEENGNVSNTKSNVQDGHPEHRNEANNYVTRIFPAKENPFIVQHGDGNVPVTASSSVEHTSDIAGDTKNSNLGEFPRGNGKDMLHLHVACEEKSKDTLNSTVMHSNFGDAESTQHSKISIEDSKETFDSPSCSEIKKEADFQENSSGQMHIGSNAQNIESSKEKFDSPSGSGTKKETDFLENSCGKIPIESNAHNTESSPANKDKRVVFQTTSHDKQTSPKSVKLSPQIPHILACKVTGNETNLDKTTNGQLMAPDSVVHNIESSSANKDERVAFQITSENNTSPTSPNDTGTAKKCTSGPLKLKTSRSRISRSALEIAITRTAFLLTFTFIVSYLPFFLVTFPRAFISDLEYTRDAMALNLIHTASRLYFITPTVNPLIFWASNLDFRRKCKHLLAKPSATITVI